MEIDIVCIYLIYSSGNCRRTSVNLSVPIRKVAKLKAHQFLLLTHDWNADQALEEFSPWACSQGITVPVTSTPEGAVARLKCPLWWQRNLYRRLARGWEATAQQLGKVSRHRALYVSDEGLRLRQSQKARACNLLAELKAINEEGDEFNLLELKEKSVSNPAIRRAELMARIAGFETIAKARGDIGMFMTITCPSRMHSTLAATDKRNPRYDGTTPDVAQKYLNKLWARARAKMGRNNIRPYGFRIAEPQHDGTPHWHLLLFVKATHSEKGVEIIQEHALREDGTEPGADKYRFRNIFIDWKKGSAAGYIAKYISKNIDGYRLDKGVNGECPEEGAMRVDAWASIWGIRQFQQIGGPPVTIYRQLRKIRSPIKGDDVLESCRVAADSGDWSSYVMAQGGPSAKRSEHAISLEKSWDDNLGRYGEPKGNTVIGITHGIFTVQTKIHTWEIEFSPLYMGEQSVLCEASSAPSGHSPAGPASASARVAGVPVSRGRNSIEDYGSYLPLEFCQ